MRRRYKNFNWEKAYTNRLASSRRLLRFEGRIPQPIMELNYLLLLQAIHRGPWRSIIALIRHELSDMWMWYCGEHWEWVRVHVLRRAPNQDEVDAQRTIDEWRAMDAMAKEL